MNGAFFVVFDTNVLVSAIFSPRGNEAQAISLWHAGKIRIAITDVVLMEYIEVLNRPRLGIDPAKVKSFLAPFVRHEPRMEPQRTLAISPHEADNRFLECAEAANADFLITGNLRHFPATHGKTRILNARSFLDVMQAGT